MRLFRLFSVTAVLFSLSTLASAAQAPAYILIDVDSGAVLEHSEAATLWHPASVTKLMTAYVTFRAIREGRLTLNSPVVVSKNALKQSSAKMGYKVGTAMTVDNALKMVIVRSANDIAVALAETVGGTEQSFVERMNAEARRLGMVSTRYHNPNGLNDSRQVTTARDMAVLARALWLEFPEYRGYFKIPAIKAGSKVLRSHNDLLERFPGANGMKTGFICDSGYNIVASATRSGRTMIVVLLGARSEEERAEIAAQLLQYGFGPNPVRSGQTLGSFGTAPAGGTVVNMRAEACSKGKKPEFHLADGKSALSPRFVLMDPVPVTTGVAGYGSSPVTGIPIPRPRPQLPGGKAAIDPGSRAGAG